MLNLTYGTSISLDLAPFTLFYILEKLLAMGLFG
jgi:hypothetical protein